MALIKTFNYKKEKLNKIEAYKYGQNWPVVYILEGKKEAYVGETINVYNRSKQHLKNKDRRKLETVHIIGDKAFNKSATLDIESLLIQYIAADGKYKLQNGNAGLTQHDYYDKEKYLGIFEDVWEALRQKDIVTRSITELRNSDIFKYSPYKALNDQQHEIVMSIKDSIINEKSSIHLVNGEPGTGKTIVAIFLMKLLKELPKTKDLKIGFVVPMTSLRGTIKNVFKTVMGLRSSMVLSPFDVVKEHYDILIVDEAHRLTRRVNISNMGAFDNVNRKLGIDIYEGDQLDWIERSADHVILCYDKNQSVRPSDILPHKIEALGAKNHRITSQMRVMGGQDYIDYIQNILHMKQEDVRYFGNYDVCLFDDVDQMVKKIKEKNDEYGLCRVVAGYAWEWQSKKDKSAYDIKIEGYGYRWNSTQKDWVNSVNALEEVGCIHTIQGYDLNYVGVIIGDEISLNNGVIEIQAGNYHDKYGKQTIKDPEVLKNFIMNIYKTLLTRGIRGTYVYVCDSELRGYFKHYMATYKNEDSAGKVAEDIAEYEV